LAQMKPVKEESKKDKECEKDLRKKTKAARKPRIAMGKKEGKEAGATGKKLKEGACKKKKARVDRPLTVNY